MSDRSDLRAEMEAALEAVLFVSGEPISRDKLLEMFDEEDRDEAREALEAVLESYADGQEGRGLMIEDVAGGLRMVTRPEMQGWLRRSFEVKGGNKLSMAALETLAIVAYHQPTTGPEIQELRGVNPSGVLKTLLEKRLIRIAGRKDVVGKPFLYTTTKEFLVHFGLKSLKDLPPLEDFEEAFGGEGEGYVDDDPRWAEVGEIDEEEEFLKEVAELEEQEAEEQEVQEVQESEEATA